MNSARVLVCAVLGAGVVVSCQDALRPREAKNPARPATDRTSAVCAGAAPVRAKSDERPSQVVQAAHAANVSELAWMTEGRIATASSDGVRIWNAEQRTL